MHTLSSTDPHLSPHFLLITTVILCLCFFFPPVRSSSYYDPLRLPSQNSSVEGEGEGKGKGKGLCSETELPSSCPVKCFIADPVCGIDGVTYWCGCGDALCSGTRVASRDFCSIGEVGSGPVSGQALLLVHIVWLILVGFLVVVGII